MKGARTSILRRTTEDVTADVAGAQLSIIKQMSRRVSLGSAGEYQADERAGVARLSWRVSGR